MAKNDPKKVTGLPTTGKPATRRIVQGGGKVKTDKRGHLQVDNPNPSGE
jgi:hypothetical protein